MWMQIVGKVKLELTPRLNDWWNVTFTVGSRGLTSSTIPFARGAFEVDFDFINHHLTIISTPSSGNSLVQNGPDFALGDCSPILAECPNQESERTQCRRPGSYDNLRCVARPERSLLGKARASSAVCMSGVE